jgi:hypothetical protein
MLNQHTLTQMVLDGIVVFAGDWPAKRSSQRWSDLWLLVVRVHPVKSDTATLATVCQMTLVRVKLVACGPVAWWVRRLARS